MNAILLAYFITGLIFAIVCRILVGKEINPNVMLSITLIWPVIGFFEIWATIADLLFVRE